jgi:hypothetical protein
MTQPKHIRGYEDEWLALALKLNEVDSITLPFGDVKRAKFARLRFYGFRRAMMNHDASNPLIANMMQTQLTVTPNGDLHFSKDPFGAILRGILEHTIVQQPKAAEELPPPTDDGHKPSMFNGAGTKHQDETLLSILSGKKKHEE